MDIKSLLKNKQILLTLGGVVVVLIVIGAVYLPGQLFKGELVAVSPTIDLAAPATEVAPTVGFELITNDNIGVTATAVEEQAPVAVLTTTTDDSAVATNETTAATGDEIPAEMTYSMIPGATLASTTLTGEELPAEETYTITPGADEAAYATDELNLAAVATDTLTDNLSSVSDYRIVTKPDYDLSCKAVSETGVFKAGEPISWVAEFSPEIDMAMTYEWTGDGLAANSGVSVDAVYENPGLYMVGVTATSIASFAAPVSFTATCSVEITAAEETLPTRILTDDTITDRPVLSCKPVSATGDFTAGREIFWAAEFSPETSQTMAYSWTGEGLLSDSGATVKALYENAGSYRVGVTATPVASVAAVIPVRAVCDVVISAAAEEEEEPAAEEEEEPAAEEEEEPVAEEEEEPVAEEEEPAAEELLVENLTEITSPAGANLSKCGLPYPDDIAGHWAEAYIKKGYDYCLFKGIDGKFHPDWEIYRIEAAAMILYALEMEPDSKCYDNDCGTPFVDLTSPEEGGIIRPLWLKGLVEGYSRTLFKPHGFLTRAEAASMVVRAFFEPFGKPCTDPHCGAGWPDNFFYDIHDKWQGQYIRVLWDKGIMTGAGPNRVEPDNYITRAEMGKMIVAAYEMMQ